MATMRWTAFPEVDGLLSELVSSVRRVLGRRFVGLYLYGSLAYDDFNPGRSDIDFVVVTDDLLSPPIIARLEDMHRHFAESDHLWAKKLEGLYIPLAEMRCFDPNGPQLPTWNEGQFYLDRPGYDWVLQRHTLREYETIIAGPSLQDLIAPVSAQAMQEAVNMVLKTWWAPMVHDPSWIKNAEYQTFAVLSMCRALYTLANGEAVSKSAAAAWAMATLDNRWRSLVHEASLWQRGKPFDRLPEVVDFIAFATA